MSSECSLLCSLQLWTLKYAGLHERDISVHSYQQKPPPTKTSILPFMNHTSSSSSTNDKTPKKAAYYDEYNDYFTSRSLPFHISNKIFHNLRDKLIELDNLLSTLKIIRTIWLRFDVVFLAFSNGTFVFIFIDKIGRMLKDISIDKTTLTKKFHITTTISDVYLNSFGFYIIYDTLSKIDIFRFNTPIRSFDSKFNLANESIRTISEELPPYSNTIPVRRWFNINHESHTVTVWWSMLAEGISTNGHSIDGDKKKSRFNCLSIIFLASNENEKDKDKDKEKMYSIQTETSNPYYCSSTPSGLTTVEMNEHQDKNGLERTYELSIYYYENFRSVPLRLVHIPSLSSSILYVIRSSSYTILCLLDNTLISIDEINHVQRSKLCVLTRNLTGLWWIIDNLVFAIADEQGSLIFYDIALNPIWPVLSSFKKLNFNHLLNLNQYLVSIDQLVVKNATSTSSNLTLLLQFSQGGPIGLLDIHFPFQNIHSLFKFYLNTQNYSYIIDLLWCLDWTRQDNDCRLAISYISQDLFRRMNTNELFYLEQILRTFYSPLRPISDASILRNRSFINQIATKFFYYLLKGKFYSQAIQLAKHLDNRTIYLDLYYACDYDNEKSIMNICAQKLQLNNNNNNSDTENDDNESGLSVTSSDDESENNKIIKQKYTMMDEKQYGDIKEILNSAIEHYKLEENLYKFLIDRIHTL
ncbi:unnamed protein product [Adineta steineri]|uniref:Uncharacterized protein n=1 Tax=Adineta steineri TaxID=433720 RepID=A0A814NAE0_9BILA|nr:unnamed protein product [Adineta steineri]CAF1090816.1 unnamed protein product [Adineta steineri]